MLSPSIGRDISRFKGVPKWKIRAAFSKSEAKRKRHMFSFQEMFVKTFTYSGTILN